MSDILIADDNHQIALVLSEYAKKEGYQAYIASDGEEALQLFHERPYSMVLLDVMMPKKDGFEVCREIRRESSTPIIMITARSEDFERIMGLDIGADDYIVKPFSPGEVMARIRAILRRLTGTPGEPEQRHNLQICALFVDLDHFTCAIDGNPIALTKKELEILWTLASARGIVFTRENLLNQVWGYDYYGDNRTVDSHIKRLRNKLDAVPHPGWRITTVWGVGYKFEECPDEK